MNRSACELARHSSSGLPLQDAALRLVDFGVAFGERIVLSAVTLAIRRQTIVALMGPGGAGKSTLLRTIAGFNEGNPSMRVWGDVWFGGRRLGDGEMPALVGQSARLLMASIFENVVHGLVNRARLTPREQRELAGELLAAAGLEHLRHRLNDPVVRLPLATQRHLAIVRCAAAEPALLCVDEPTSDLGDEDSARLLDYLAREGERRAILVVLHNQDQARRLAHEVALLAGGVIQESARTADFFDSPRSRAARDFVRNGSCAVPAPDADPSSLESSAESPHPPAMAVLNAARGAGPRGFYWLKPGRLAGTPRPGIVADMDDDLSALRSVGITVLISLTRKPFDAALLAGYGIRAHWSAIRDMGAPTVRQAEQLCLVIDDFLAEGEAVAVHCRAGLGRTGTILSCYLIWEGLDALSALETARRIEPKWVQSEEQVLFLQEFAHAVKKRAAARRTGASRSGSLKSNASP